MALRWLARHLIAPHRSSQLLTAPECVKVCARSLGSSDHPIPWYSILTIAAPCCPTLVLQSRLLKWRPWITRCQRAINRYVKGWLAHNDDAGDGRLPHDCHGIFGFVDGTLRPTCRPGDQDHHGGVLDLQRQLYSGHKHRHGIWRGGTGSSPSGATDGRAPPEKQRLLNRLGRPVG